jgi:hypothetical protein
MKITPSILVACGLFSADTAPIATRYQNLMCDQIETEVDRISRRALAVFAKADGQAAAEWARLRSEFDALDRVSIEKDCNVQLAPRTKI